MIEAVNLTKSFANQVVVRALSFQAEPGEVVCLLGGEGTGKSMALDLFLNLLKPTSGVSKLGGFDVTLQPVETKRRLGYVPAGMPLYDQLTGWENVKYLGTLAGYDDFTPAAIRDLFRELGLEAGIADQQARGYDGPTRARVGLAIALARNAKEFLLDDPTRGFAAEAAQGFADLVRRLAAGEIGGEPVTVLWATRDPEMARRADRVGMLAKGKPVKWMAARDYSASEFASECRAHQS